MLSKETSLKEKLSKEYEHSIKPILKNINQESITYETSGFLKANLAKYPADSSIPPPRKKKSGINCKNN